MPSATASPTPPGWHRPAFALGRGFGVRADPGGTWFAWRRTTRDEVWVDDPGSTSTFRWERQSVLVIR